MPARPHGPRTWFFRAATVALAITAVEGTAFVAILALNATPGTPILRNGIFFAEQASRMRMLLDENRPGALMLDADLGWRPRPGFAGHGDDINAQGLRSTHEYAAIPPPGVLRIAAFGDSFVYGAEVATADSWPARMETLDASVEVLNYGVNAYGVDQAYLRYLTEGTALAPQVVVLGFYEDDLARLVNVYRGFLSAESPLVKPRFTVTDNGELRLLPNPMPPPVYREVAQDPKRLLELGVHDHWYRRLVFENPLYDRSASVRLLTTLGYRVYERHFDPQRIVQIPNRWPRRGDQPWRYRRAAEAYKIQLALVAAFDAAVRGRGALPIIVVFPTKGEMRTAFDARSDLAYAPLIEDLRARGATVLDVADAIAELGSRNDVERYFEPHQHYSPRANDMVARWLSHRVRELIARGA